jgi:hypothetical protein
MSKINYLSTKIIKEIINKIESGKKIKRSERIFHQNNTDLLNTNLPFLYTKKEIGEYYKCSQDPIFFMENYCYIKCPNQGKNKITLRGYQKDWIEEYKENRFILNISSRQTGLSLIRSLLNLWELVFNKKSILLKSNKKNTSIEHLDKIKFSYLNLPYFLREPILIFNKTNISFRNGSYIKIDNSVSNYNIIDIVEGFNLSNEKQLNIIKYLIPVMSALKESKLIISGQPIGNSPFYKLTSSPLFKVIRTYWWQVPGRDEKWADKEKSKIGEKNFDREYNLIFKS